MNDKLEVAKLACQLTISVIENNDGQLGKIAYASRKNADDKDTPEFLLVFDAIFEHICQRVEQQ